MALKNVDPYEVSIAPKIEGHLVTATIEIVVPLNYLNGALVFHLEYTSHLSEDFLPDARGPIISTHYSQDIGSSRCSPIHAALDNTIQHNIKMVLDYFHFVRQCLHTDRRIPPRLDDFRKMLRIDAELATTLIINCDKQ